MCFSRKPPEYLPGAFGFKAGPRCQFSRKDEQHSTAEQSADKRLSPFPALSHPAVLVGHHSHNHHRNEQKHEPHDIVAMTVFHCNQGFPFLFHKGEIVPVRETVVQRFQLFSRNPSGAANTGGQQLSVLNTISQW